MNGPKLTLYFDGACPFCRTEMARLRAWDRGGRLAFVDIAADGFDPAAVGVSLAALNRELHTRTVAGTLLVGLDSMLAAYTLVGRGALVAPLRISSLRPPLARLYRLFARHRYGMSRWLGYRRDRACAEASCPLGNPFMKSAPAARHGERT
ncbi:MAG: DUF393 domain-containing protein [Pseudomonadota bacterium]